MSVISTAEAAAAADGQTVTLEGTYLKRMRRKGMSRPGRPSPKVFLGYVQIELVGEGETRRIQLGTEPRPEAEVSAFADKRVQVNGRLVLSPAVEPGVATTMPRPTLMDASEPALVE